MNAPLEEPVLTFDVEACVYRLDDHQSEAKLWRAVAAGTITAEAAELLFAKWKRIAPRRIAEEETRRAA